MLTHHATLALTLAAVLSVAACESETDSTNGSAPLPDVTLDTTPSAAARVAPAPDAPQTANPPAADVDRDDDVAPAPNRPDPPTAVIPATFRGKWDRTTSACAQQTSEMRLNVDAGSIRFYEGRSRALAVRETSSGVEVDVEHSAEGTTDRRTYQLSRSGNKLTVTISGYATTRVRCASM